MKRRTVLVVLGSMAVGAVLWFGFVWASVHVETFVNRANTAHEMAWEQHLRLLHLEREMEKLDGVATEFPFMREAVRRSLTRTAAGQ